MLLINNQEVEKLFTMKDCLAALEDGYDDLLKGDAVYRPRLDLWMPCERPDGDVGAENCECQISWRCHQDWLLRPMFFS